VVHNTGHAAKNPAGESPPLDSDPLSDAESEKNLAGCQDNSPQFRVAASSSKKSGQLFIRSHNETLSIAAMRVCDPDRSPLRING
jgi:hypothetical protein